MLQSLITIKVSVAILVIALVSILSISGTYLVVKNSNQEICKPIKNSIQKPFRHIPTNNGRGF